MMPFITEQRPTTLPFVGGLNSYHADYSHAIMANKSSSLGMFMNGENGFSYDIKAISDSVDSGFIAEPDWVLSDADFIKWVRGFATDGE